jgi:hypothetical protein
MSKPQESRAARTAVLRKIPTTGSVARTLEETFMIPTFTRRLASLAAVSMLSLSALAFCDLASAQSTGGPSAAETTPPGADKPPEQQAIDACVGKKEGDRVRFVTAKGKKRHWACVTVGGVLAARSGIATPARPDKK